MRLMSGIAAGTRLSSFDSLIALAAISALGGMAFFRSSFWLLSNLPVYPLFLPFLLELLLSDIDMSISLDLLVYGLCSLDEF